MSATPSLKITDSHSTAKHPVKPYCNEKTAEKRAWIYRLACGNCVPDEGERAQPIRSSPSPFFAARRINEQGGFSITRGVAIVGAAGDAILNSIAGKMVVVPMAVLMDVA